MFEKKWKLASFYFIFERSIHPHEFIEMQYHVVIIRGKVKPQVSIEAWMDGVPPPPISETILYCKCEPSSVYIITSVMPRNIKLVLPQRLKHTQGPVFISETTLNVHG